MTQELPSLKNKNYRINGEEKKALKKKGGEPVQTSWTNLRTHLNEPAVKAIGDAHIERK